MSGVVMFCGSRSFQSASQVGAVVCSVLGGGRCVATGCAAGADALAVSSVLAQGAASRLSVLAVGCSSGQGFAGSASAFAGVVSAQAAGASVQWLAGGALSLPLRARLARRSLACVRSSAVGAGSGLVAFVSGPPPRRFGVGAFPSCGSGSWSSVAAAAAIGLPVVVFGCAESQLPVLPVFGHWVRAGSGVWQGAFLFEKSQALFLF